MITYGFILFLQALLYAITAGFSGFANVTSDGGITSGIAQISGYLSAVPFTNTIVAILGSMAFLLVFEAGYWVYKGIKWIYNKIPGIS